MIWCHVLSHLVSVEDFIVRTSYLLSVVALPVLAACSDRTTATSPLAPNGAALHAGKPGSPTDPTATWIYPLNDAALAVRSDHLYSDGSNSVYADGVCNISTTIFATTARSNSGDATLNTGANGRCIRHFTFAYPDGYSETLPSFNNLRMIENSTYSIPIGTTVERQLHMTSMGRSPRSRGLSSSCAPPPFRRADRASRAAPVRRLRTISDSCRARCST